jgi:hypothetical protein
MACDTIAVADLKPARIGSEIASLDEDEVFSLGELELLRKAPSE